MFVYNTHYMANIKSAIKRINVTKAKQSKNNCYSCPKNLHMLLFYSFSLNFKEALAANELKHAEMQLNVVFSVLDAAAIDNVIHKNKANRQKAKLAAALNKAQSTKHKN